MYVIAGLLLNTHAYNNIINSEYYTMTFTPLQAPPRVPPPERGSC